MDVLLRILLALAPPEYRENYGREMLRDLHDALRAERGEGRSGRALFARMLGDLLSAIFVERITMAARDFRYAFRAFMRTPWVTLVMIVTLALGIGANVSAFSIVNGVLFNPLPYDHADRMVVVYRTVWINTFYCTICPHSLYTSFALQDGNRTFEAIAPFTRWNATLTGTGDPQTLPGAQVGSQIFDVAHAKPLLGRLFTRADEQPNAPHVVVLSYQFWKATLNGDQNVVGRTLVLDDVPSRVIGILPESFVFPVYERLGRERPAIFGPFNRSDGEKPGRNSLGMVGRLRPGVSFAQATGDLNRIVDALAIKYPLYYKSKDLVERLRIVSAAESIFGPIQGQLFVLLAAAFVVLLVACLNVANLLLARAVLQQRDVALRLAVGASKRNIVRHISIDSVLLATIAAGLGLVIAYYGIGAFVRLAPRGLPRVDQITTSWPVFAYALGVALVTAFFTALFPTMMLWRVQIASVLKNADRSRVRSGGGTMRNTLVVTQITLAFALLIECGLMLQAANHMVATDLGYDTAGLTTVAGQAVNGHRYTSPARQWAYLNGAQSHLAAIPGVKAVAYGTTVPLASNESDTTITVVGSPRTDLDSEVYYVSQGYFGVLGFHALEGRLFDASDRVGSRPVIVVNAAFAKNFTNGKPLGRQVRVGETTYTIVGVVPNMKLNSLFDTISPQIFFNAGQIANANINGMVLMFALRTGTEAPIQNAVAAAWRANDPLEPAPAVTTVNAAAARTVAPIRAYGAIMAALALIALVLAITGTASVVAYAVARRTHEIGVRIALGARPLRIVRRLLRGAAVMTALGIASGLLIAFAAAQSLSSQFFGGAFTIAAFDAPTYMLATAILVIATFTASFVPAFRAASSDPARALRYE